MKVGIIGVAQEGISAAKTLQAAGADIDVDLFTRSGEQPYNRTLVNKGAAIGLLEPDQIALPATGVETIADTVRGIDPRSRDVHLDSGQSHTTTRSSLPAAVGRGPSMRRSSAETKLSVLGGSPPCTRSRMPSGSATCSRLRTLPVC